MKCIIPLNGLQQFRHWLNDSIMVLFNRYKFVSGYQWRILVQQAHDFWKQFPPAATLLQSTWESSRVTGWPLNSLFCPPSNHTFWNQTPLEVWLFYCHCCPQLKSSLPHLPRIVEFRFHNTPILITSHVTCLTVYSTMPLSQAELLNLGQKSTNSWAMRWSPLSSFLPFLLPHKYGLSYSLRSVSPPPQNLCWRHTFSNVNSSHSHIIHASLDSG